MNFLIKHIIFMPTQVNPNKNNEGKRCGEILEDTPKFQLFNAFSLLFLLSLAKPLSLPLKVTPVISKHIYLQVDETGPVRKAF